MSANSKRPLFIVDCDEVIFHHAVPLAKWLIERHEIDFPLMRGRARRLDDGSTVSPRQLSDLCELFARDELSRQTLADGAREALAAFAEAGDVVILTNIADRHRDARVRQFAAHGMHYPILCNDGLKGAAVARLVGDRPAVFIDDNAAHHADVSKAAPHVRRLQLIAEPRIADLTPASRYAHARHDCWSSMTGWLLGRGSPGWVSDLEASVLIVGLETIS